MCYVIVATKDQFGFSLFQFCYKLVKFIQPLIFKILPVIPRSSRWEISIDESQIAKVHLKYTPFVITYCVPVAIDNIIRFDFCENGYPAVSFFLSGKPVVLILQIAE